MKHTEDPSPEEREPEQYAGKFIRDPWDTDPAEKTGEENTDGNLDPGPVSGQSA